MQRPPNPALVAQRQPHPADAHLQTPPPLSKPASAPYSIYPPAPPVKSLRLGTHNTSHPAVPIPAGPESRSPTPSRGHDARLPPAPPSEYITNTGPLDLRHKQAFTLVKEEPLKRPSSRLVPSRRRSDANSSAYRTPPEYPDQVMRIPYPLPLSTVRAASPLPSQLTSHSQGIANVAPQSSEYLERYQPVTAAVRTTEARRLRRVTASLSEENSGRGRSEQTWSDDAGDWGRVGAELRRFFTRR
ncbi:hypothetical protein FALBO_4805 [Fusarium albosuccineum]|uniref:Uncharacterized protein n=1 Tax=Fusarium albosuccineum TaxID=1237068 RepID=A0A8H4LF75_9HYPO|nr:hypothetical protein FALBO_4805 [Fusarium albosuccineum]